MMTNVRARKGGRQVQTLDPLVPAWWRMGVVSKTLRRKTPKADAGFCHGPTG